MHEGEGLGPKVLINVFDDKMTSKWNAELQNTIEWSQLFVYNTAYKKIKESVAIYYRGETFFKIWALPAKSGQWGVVGEGGGEVNWTLHPINTTN